MGKFHAYQVAPEYQESPIDKEFPGNISVFGNKDYDDHKSDEVEWILNRIVSSHLADDLYEAKWGEYFDIMVKCFFRDSIYPKPDGITSEKFFDLSSVEIIELAKSIIGIEYAYENEGYFDKEEAYCTIFSVLTNKEYDYKCIRGCCQRDWNYAYFPKEEWTKEYLEQFEAEYYNLGSEWTVFEEWDESEENEEEVGDRDYIDTVYCYKYDTEDIRKEIAEWIGEAPEEIVLHEFCGWIKTPNYQVR